MENKEYSKDVSRKIRTSPCSWSTQAKIKTELIKYEELRKSKDGNIEVKCHYCGNWFEPQRSQLEARLTAIESPVTLQNENRIYCSDNCKLSCPTFKNRNGYVRYKKASSREVQPQLRQLVFNRDNWTCTKCGVHKNDLNSPIHCHHIKPVVNDPIESADVDNCITVCKECHKKIHKLFGCDYASLRC